MLRIATFVLGQPSLTAATGGEVEDETARMGIVHGGAEGPTTANGRTGSGPAPHPLELDIVAGALFVLKEGQFFPYNSPSPEATRHRASNASSQIPRHPLRSRPRLE